MSGKYSSDITIPIPKEVSNAWNTAGMIILLYGVIYVLIKFFVFRNPEEGITDAIKILAPDVESLFLTAILTIIILIIWLYKKSKD